MAEGYQALYRRYRSKRFSELRGQPNVVRALRNAVAEGRVGHAYLFSGPRGTGKTSTARILAKVLNCADPVEGEPCGSCDACLTVDEGRIVDWLQEHDAASNRGIDRMKDILERIPLGTSGNRKVVILDEVHMLTPQASNALLKSLEEPPEHVIFVLATTDPQLVLPTIRSRAQHLEFHLLPTDELADHVRWVIRDAGLDLDEEAVQHVLRVGGGSARDTLSALDQVAAMGGVVATEEPVDAVLDALCDRDAGAVLAAVADAVHAGRDVRALGSAIVARLRDAFLEKMGAGDRHLPEADQARAAALAARLGASVLTRSLEVIGEALTDITKKPDTRVALEVALVRLCRSGDDSDVLALAERVAWLERKLGEGGASGAGDRSASSADRQSPTSMAPPGAGPAAARSELEARGVPTGPVVPPVKKAAPRRPAGGGAGTPEPGSSHPEASPPPRGGSEAESPAGLPALAELEAAWTAAVLEDLPLGAKNMFRMGRFVASGEPAGAAAFALPNAPHRDHCEKKRPEVEAALARHFGRPVPLRLVVEPSAGVPSAGSGAGPGSGHDEAVDVDDLRDAPDASTGIDRLTQAFPGAELLDEP